MSHTRRTGLLIRIDKRRPGTLQQQIYAGIRSAILDGIIAPGARLPSSRALAADLCVSRTTMLIALEQLTAEGYLAARRGSGTYVADELPDAPRWTATASGRTSHPALSRRGEALAGTPPAAHRVGRAPRPFRLGVPALNLFPVKLWAQLAARRLRSITEAQLDYGEVAGLRDLRRAIAAHVQTSRGTRCDADQVLVVSGSKPGLDLIARLILDPGDQAWLEEPGYPGARGALLAAGARIVPVRVDGEGLDVAEGARRASGARLVYVTPSHQFPLGVPMSLGRRLALLRWAGRARAWIVEDDYDSEFRHAAHAEPCLHGLDSDGRVIYVGSFSKTLFPSLRLGFLIVPSDLRDRMVAARRALDHHPPVILQAILADFIAGGHFERHLRYSPSRRDRRPLPRRSRRPRPPPPTPPTSSACRSQACTRQSGGRSGAPRGRLRLDTSMVLWYHYTRIHEVEMNRAGSFLLGGVVAGAAVLGWPRLAQHVGCNARQREDALAHTEVTFRFIADAPMSRVAPLFGADRERLWAPDWAPRFLHPAVAADQEGMVFTVAHGHGDAVWINTRFDLTAGIVQYVYVLPSVVATTVTLHLTPDGERTRVEVTYARTALTPEANARVNQMAVHDRAAGSEWERQINGYLPRAG